MDATIGKISDTKHSLKLKNLGLNGPYSVAWPKNKDGSPLTTAGMTREDVSWNLIRIPLLCKECISEEGILVR